MATSSVSVRAGAPVRSTKKTNKGLRPLRLLRALSVAVALSAAAALLCELGVLPLPPSLLFLRQTPGVVSMGNNPYTAIAGATETLSIQLAGTGTANAALTYILAYPNKKVVRAHVHADAHGYSSYTFRLRGYKPRHYRDTAWIGVRDAAGTVKAGLYFAIQRRR